MAGIQNKVGFLEGGGILLYCAKGGQSCQKSLLMNQVCVDCRGVCVCRGGGGGEYTLPSLYS